MATTPTYINQRINNLQSQINSIISGGGGGVPTSSNLGTVLTNGNSAGTSDIDMNFNDITNVNSVVIDNNAGNTITAGSNQINFTSTLNNPSVISNSSGQDMNVASSATLNLSASTNIDATATTFNTTAVNDIFTTATNSTIALTAGTNITLYSSGLGDINLNAPNVNSNGYAMPICFTRERNDTFSYSSGGQSMDNVYNASIAVPYQFFTDQPLGNYTSTKWKIDFALNCYSNTNTGDKGLALYFDFQDTSTTFTFTPNTYNANTPYAVYQPAASYSAVGNAPFQNFNWTDWCDFGALQGQTSSALPLNMRLYFAGDSPFNCSFYMAITFTRTNLI